MRTFVGILFFLITCAVAVSAQQEQLYTQFMYGKLTFNPAYAGSNEHMAIGLLHRTQWAGINGAPTTQTFRIVGIHHEDAERVRV